MSIGDDLRETVEQAIETKQRIAHGIIRAVARGYLIGFFGTAAVIVLIASLRKRPPKWEYLDLRSTSWIVLVVCGWVGGVALVVFVAYS